jgi:transcriptional regulator with XRE-family HTH domain
MQATPRQVMNDAAKFGEHLRRWRQRRGLSQLDLAHRAATTQRHLSFLELGRASPSRDMVLRLAVALDVPLRQHNALLLAAGFAPEWRESTLGAPELAQVDSALGHMLGQQEPYPAVVIDRHWKVLRANAGAVRMVEFLLGGLPADANLADALVAPDALRPYLVNWEDVAGYFIRSVEADAASDGNPQTEALLARLLAYPGVKRLQGRAALEVTAAPVLSMRFHKDGTVLDLFTTIATLGTPQDITLQELRVECFFPADDATAQVFADWERRAARS